MNLVAFDNWMLARADALLTWAWDRFDIRKPMVVRALLFLWVLLDYAWVQQVDGRVKPIHFVLWVIIGASYHLHELIGGHSNRSVAIRRLSLFSRIVRCWALSSGAIVILLAILRLETALFAAVEIVWWAFILLGDAVLPDRPRRRPEPRVAKNLAWGDA